MDSVYVCACTSICLCMHKHMYQRCNSCKSIWIQNTYNIYLSCYLTSSSKYKCVDWLRLHPCPCTWRYVVVVVCLLVLTCRVSLIHNHWILAGCVICHMAGHLNVQVPRFSVVLSPAKVGRWRIPPLAGSHRCDLAAPKHSTVRPQLHQW